MFCIGEFETVRNFADVRKKWRSMVKYGGLLVGKCMPDYNLMHKSKNHHRRSSKILHSGSHASIENDLARGYTESEVRKKIQQKI